MSIYVLKEYVEECLKEGIEPSFEGLRLYNKIRVMKVANK